MTNFETEKEELNDQMRFWHSELQEITDNKIKVAIEEILKNMSNLFDLMDQVDIKELYYFRQCKIKYLIKEITNLRDECEQRHVEEFNKGIEILKKIFDDYDF